MFALQRIARTAPVFLRPFENQSRTFLSTPPRVRISLAEKLMLGVVLYVGIMAIPMWVTFHIKDYNAAKHTDE